MQSGLFLLPFGLFRLLSLQGLAFRLEPGLGHGDLSLVTLRLRLGGQALRLKALGLFLAQTGLFLLLRYQGQAFGLDARQLGGDLTLPPFEGGQPLRLVRGGGHCRGRGGLVISHWPGRREGAAEGRGLIHAGGGRLASRQCGRWCFQASGGRQGGCGTLEIGRLAFDRG